LPRKGGLLSALRGTCAPPLLRQPPPAARIDLEKLNRAGLWAHADVAKSFTGNRGLNRSRVGVSQNRKPRFIDHAPAAGRKRVILGPAPAGSKMVSGLLSITAHDLHAAMRRIAPAAVRCHEVNGWWSHLHGLYWEKVRPPS